MGYGQITSSPKLSLMVEEQKGGKWLRSEENRVEMVESMKRKQQAVNEMSEAEWRAQLAEGDLCDHHDLAEEEGAQEEDPDEGRPARKPQWREARVLKVNEDDTLVVGWRGVHGHAVTLARSSELIDKPYAKARDWRNQLRTKTKVEVHMDAVALSDGKLPSEVAPIYKMGTSYVRTPID